MVRPLVALLLALAPLAHAYPAEWPLSDARVGRAAATSRGSILAVAGDDRFLVAWVSIDRGGQAAVLDLDGKPIADTSIALPLTPYALFWRDDAWTIVGRTMDAWAWVRVSRDGVLLDRAAHPLALSGITFEGAAWTGTSLIVAGPAGKSVGVSVFDGNLDLRTSYAIPTADHAFGVNVATDDQTALVTYRVASSAPSLPLYAVLLDSEGTVVR